MELIVNGESICFAGNPRALHRFMRLQYGIDVQEGQLSGITGGFEWQIVRSAEYIDSLADFGSANLNFPS